MGSGSGVLAAKIVVPAGSLAFEGIGTIVRSGLRTVVPSLSMDVGKSNKQLEQRSPAARSCLLNCGVRRSDIRGTV
jgi:hypothetical protein